NNVNLLEIQYSDVYFPICVSTNVLKMTINKQLDFKTKNIFFDKKWIRIICFPFLFQRKISEIRSEEEAFFKSLLEECISLRLKVKTTTKRALVRMSQSKHPLEYVQEYVRMAREATIDKENLDYLNHHKTFYICDITDNLQYLMIVVEMGSFVVCCENGGLPSHNALSSLQFFEITHHNITPTCLDTAKLMMVHTTDNEHSKFAFNFRRKHYGKNERENRYLEEFWNDLVFSKEKGKYCFKDDSTILLISFFFFI
ncbi:hypothetical protein RFI_26420, partial [Reticulomyxa filosa]